MELISVHVPKTAGVTFRTLLRRVYGDASISLDYADRALDPLSIFQTDPSLWRAAADQTAAQTPPGIRVVHGHFNGAKYDHAFPTARKIVWLREPVARLVSHYHYWRTLPRSPHSLHQRLLDENLSLLDFARLPPMRNILANVFLRDCRLAEFAFVGVQEHFTADLSRLGQLLGWPADLSVPAENRNEQASYQTLRLADAEQAEIVSLNREDIALYQQALVFRAA